MWVVVYFCLHTYTQGLTRRRENVHSQKHKIFYFKLQWSRHPRCLMSGRVMPVGAEWVAAKPRILTEKQRKRRVSCTCMVVYFEASCLGLKIKKMWRFTRQCLPANMSWFNRGRRFCCKLNTVYYLAILLEYNLPLDPHFVWKLA